MGKKRYLSAREAAGELGISVATLYSYVSRGLVRSEAVGGRGRRYRAEDVRRLRERAERRRDPDRSVAGALDWGTAVMESAITLVGDEGVFYRGRDVSSLAAGSRIEEVAALLWLGDETLAGELFRGDGSSVPERSREATFGLPPFEAFQVVLPLVAAGDPAAYDLRARPVAGRGARIMRLMAVVASGEGEVSSGISGTLGGGWGLDGDGAALLDAAMVLCADHELPVSTFAARCVASSGATPYAAVQAGLAALGGTKHGGMLDLVEAFAREVEAVGEARAVVAGRLRRGDGVPGFGHTLYPGGDPRGRALLEMLKERYQRSVAVELAGEVEEGVMELTGDRPTIDFGLVVLSRALGLPEGAALALFAIGRTAGWVAHAIEQYQTGALIRPRARYTGKPPE